MEQPQSKSPATAKRAMIESNVKLMDPESLPSGLRACAAMESQVQTQLQCPSPVLDTSVATQSNVLQFLCPSLVPSTSFAIEGDVVQVIFKLFSGFWHKYCYKWRCAGQFISENSSAISNIVPIGSPSL
ncbi:unnamed protein product [Arctia plantaginis]|uniref:Uncharacterized protein n=1 Tax=Arctia plantaginis TaxID=874455 RepID=A0A8S1AXL6_ARCPL|nr:unnamed protein product [Arctia plantaginis]